MGDAVLTGQTLPCQVVAVEGKEYKPVGFA